MPIGGPYQIQVINGMDYAMRNLDAKNKKICALTKDDPYGETGLAGLEYAAEQGWTSPIASQATFKQGDTDFTAQINQLQGADCEIVVFVGLPTETGADAHRRGRPRLRADVARSVADVVERLRQPRVARRRTSRRTSCCISEGPQWGDTSVPGMSQMLDDITAYAPGPEARHLLRLRVLAGLGGRPDPREGRRRRRPQPRWGPQGVRGDQRADLRRSAR